MLYDSTTGLVLEVRQGNAGLLQRLAAAGHQLQPAGAACCQRVAELQDVLNGPVMAQRGEILEQVHNHTHTHTHAHTYNLHLYTHMVPMQAQPVPVDEAWM